MSGSDQGPLVRRGEADPSRRFALAAWLFQRALAVVIGIAFASLAVQVRGLLGERGIVPLSQQLAWLARDGVGFLDAPSIFWWLGASSGTLVAAAWSGVGLAALLFLGVAPRLTVLLAWALYLSFTSVGDPFLSFQWDALLLETCLLAPFVLPGGWFVSPRRAPEPGRVGLLLARFLLLRLMLLSGLVKLGSGDPVWRDFSALAYHFWTQPLPGPLSWWAAHLPPTLLGAACAVALAIELVLPLLVFGPRPLRLVAAAGFTVLQLAIGLTGNYGFFNLLTLALVVLLVDDSVLARLPARAEARPAPGPLRQAAAGLAAAMALIATVHAARRLELPVPEPLVELARAAAPLGSLNAYGLFADMTTERPEIEVEGSTDGQSWEPLRFRWKPRVDGSPREAFFHMPRLDWQMWFAALGTCRRQAWLHLFLKAVLEGSPDVRELLDGPAPSKRPPVLVRTTLARYRMTTPDERERSGATWAREVVGPYCPTVRLGPDGKLEAVEPNPHVAGSGG